MDTSTQSTGGPHPEEVAGRWPYRPNVRGLRHFAATGHYLGAHAAFSILEAGGNAIDAGVAAGMVEAVVQPDQVNFAGVAPIIIYLAQPQQVLSISGLGTWPKAATCEFFAKTFGPIVPEGLMRTVVPAAPATWIFALRRFGTLRFADVVKPALDLARNGFPIHEFTAAEIRKRAAHYGRWDENARIYLPSGRPPEPGEIFLQHDLARTLQYMVDQEDSVLSHGRDAALQAAHDAFYRGDIAAAIVRHHRTHGGLMTAEDMASYEPKIEEPATVRYKGLDVYTCGFWTQGPVLLQALNILSGFDLKTMGHNSADYLHVVAESLKLAFADREAFYGDPDFVPVPGAQLLSKAYADERRKLIRRDTAWPEMPPAGNGAGVAPEESGSAIMPSADTSYVCTMDRQGNIFTASPSDPSYDTEVIPGTGLCPSSRGSQSRAIPTHPSCVAPGKRPRLTPNPVLAFENGRPRYALGTPGGDVQPQAILQAFLAMETFGLDPQNAVEAPRAISRSFPDSFAPHAYYPGELNIEQRVPNAVGQELARRGHGVKWWPARTSRAGSVCATAFNPTDGSFAIGADYRRISYALGW